MEYEFKSDSWYNRVTFKRTYRGAVNGITYRVGKVICTDKFTIPFSEW